MKTLLQLRFAQHTVPSPEHWWITPALLCNQDPHTGAVQASKNQRDLPQPPVASPSLYPTPKVMLLAGCWV